MSFNICIVSFACSLRASVDSLLSLASSTAMTRLVNSNWQNVCLLTMTPKLKGHAINVDHFLNVAQNVSLCLDDEHVGQNYH